MIRLFNPVMRRLLVTRLPAGPNALLRVHGRRSGLPRTFPIAFVDLGERSYIQGTSGDVDWVHNLRATGEGQIIKGGRRETFKATELDPETGGRVFHDLLAPFPHSRLIRSVVGPVERPPVAILRYFRIRVDDTLDEYIARRAPTAAVRTPPAQFPSVGDLRGCSLL